MPLRRFLNNLNKELQDAANAFNNNGAGAGRGYSNNGLNSSGQPAPTPTNHGIHSLIGGFSSLVQQASSSPYQQPQPLAHQISSNPPPCPRTTPQPNHADWLTLPNFPNFHVCPSCFNALIRPTPFAGYFTPKPPSPTPVRCDLSRFWVRVAGAVLLLNQDRRLDISLLPRVAVIRAQDGPCPNSQLANEGAPLITQQRAWYTLRDPHTGAELLPGWTVCAECVLNMQNCCPSVSTAFSLAHPLGQPPVPQQPGQPPQQWQSTCALVPSELYDDPRTMAILQQLGSCAALASTTGQVNMNILVNWLRTNLPSPRVPGQGSGPGQAQAPNGLCPRNFPSTTLKCHTIPSMIDFTVCEQCYAEIIRPDADQGVQMALQFDSQPRAVPGQGFTCQLYSPRMRGVWKETCLLPNGSEYLRQKVGSHPPIQKLGR